MKRILVCLILCLTLLAACGDPEPMPVPTALPPLATLEPTATPEPTAVPTATPTVLSDPIPGALTVDPALDLGPISPYIYGTNYGPMQAVPLEMMPLVLDAGFTTLRYPAGAWTDEVDIKPFQLDQFVDFYGQFGAMPTVSVRLKNGTAETAAMLVAYANIVKGYGIEYWSIGNEPTLFTEQLGEDYNTERFNREWRAIALAMKAVDPTIKLIGPELHQWGIDPGSTLKDAAGLDWMDEFLKVNGDLVDVVSVHRYPLWKPSGQEVTIDELRANLPEWNKLVTYLEQVTKEITGRDLPVAFTEVNSSPTGVLGQPASPDAFFNAIWYADVLGRMMDQDVFMVNQWVISQRSTGLGLIFGNEVRPTLYTFYMYKHFGNQQRFAASGVENVRIYAAQRADGALTLMVINLGDAEVTAPLQIQGLTPTEAQVYLLDATHNAEDLGIQSWPADGVVTLPGQSVILFVVE